MNGQPVRIVTSPYSDVKSGERGRLLFIKNYCRNPQPRPEKHCCRPFCGFDEVGQIAFTGNRSRLFRPTEWKKYGMRKEVKHPC